MRAIMETSFDVFYLIFVVSMGVYLIKIDDKSSDSKLFGIMAVVLGLGDSFHLIPRIFALNTENGFEVYRVALGMGKAITSITMTGFYLILYRIYKRRYQIEDKKLDLTIYLLSAIRVIISLFPQNRWLDAIQPISWAIYRNIPFAIMGLILIVLFYQKAKEHNDRAYKYMWLAITLSFAFYIPVVLWADQYPNIGLLMIPKTMAYVWVVIMGYQDYRLKKNK